MPMMKASAIEPEMATTISRLLAQDPPMAVAGHPEAVTGVR
jgi:hypothetical protein